MKNTGIIRRMDDLGRIVIPKEIRHNIGIREGDPFEISYDEELKMVSFTLRPEEIKATEIIQRTKIYISEFDTISEEAKREVFTLLDNAIKVMRTSMNKENEHGC